nr:hypothetical protein [Stella humosa]
MADDVAGGFLDYQRQVECGAVGDPFLGAECLDEFGDRLQIFEGFADSYRSSGHARLIFRMRYRGRRIRFREPVTTSIVARYASRG